MSTNAQIEQIKEWYRLMTPGQRAQLIEEIDEEYCLHCGDPHPKYPFSFSKFPCTYDE